MSSAETRQAEADNRIAMEALAKGQPIPSDVARRIQERAEKARQELLRSHGVQASGVQILREMRGDLPEQ